METAYAKGNGGEGMTIALIIIGFALAAMISVADHYRTKCEFLKRENERIEGQLKRALSIQNLSVMYGPQEVAAAHPAPTSPQKPESVKLRGRKTWQEIAATVEYLTSPEAVAERSKLSREEAAKELKEALNG